MEKNGNSSNIWRGVNIASEIIKCGSKMEVNNRRKTLFWMDQWLEDHPLRQDALHEMTLEESYRTIKDYWDSNMGWDYDTLSSLLPNRIITELAFFHS